MHEKTSRRPTEMGDRALLGAHFILGIVVALCLMPAFVSGAVVFETATYNGPGSISGLTLSSNQIWGVRFALTETSFVDEIGGDFSRFTGQPAGDIFGAIVALSGPTDFPDSFPGTGGFTTPDVLATAVLGPLPSQLAPSVLLTSSVSVTLAPGDYALVFGSGLFGAVGGSIIQASHTEIGNQDYIRGTGAGWVTNASANSLYLFISSSAVIPEPSTLSLVLLASLSLASRRRSRGRHR